MKKLTLHSSFLKKSLIIFLLFVSYFSYTKAQNPILYGMTPFSNGYGTGNIFKYDPTSDVYNNLYVLTGTAGAQPIGKLVEASDGNLYGMASNGGTSGHGVIFSFNPTTVVFSGVVFFSGTLCC